ncbi:MULTISPECIES: DUF4112 domain-containing protein [Methylobacterium]|uniref:DUF4112 domain-containing protein n=1 Tax=Methylobacterium jeotgali TaxID=381630 RepID=A0ABQ4T399_9HYPH|nr:MULTISPECIES: DUF4112 domain-containing protein [Methylobacterium]GJE08499.1 hypothetical protein AOPFMNJM_3838 [Methylobacterium jeotgali]
MAFQNAAGAQTPYRFADMSHEATLLRLEKLAFLLDSAFLLPGLNRRVGIDAALGLIPIVGDFAGMVLSSYILFEARRLGVPRHIQARMAMNIAFDGLVGAVPVAGDLFDAAFKANRRNVRLLRRHLERTGAVRLGEIEGTATRLD